MFGLRTSKQTIHHWFISIASWLVIHQESIEHWSRDLGHLWTTFFSLRETEIRGTTSSGYQTTFQMYSHSRAWKEKFKQQYFFWGFIGLASSSNIQCAPFSLNYFLSTWKFTSIIWLFICSQRVHWEHVRQVFTSYCKRANLRLRPEGNSDAGFCRSS